MVDQVLRDPRANTARLTRCERFAIARGEYTCIAQELMPEGTALRGPGKLVLQPGTGAAGTQGKGTPICVLKSAP